MPTTPFEWFLQNKNRKCTEFLEQNEDVSGFVAALLDHCREFCEQEGIPVRALQLDKPFVTNDGKIVAQMRKAPM